MKLQNPGLCLVLAIVLEAIQQQFVNVPAPVTAAPWNHQHFKAFQSISKENF